MLACYPQRLDHPPTSSVDQGEDEEGYTPPVGLIIPGHIKTVSWGSIQSAGVAMHDCWGEQRHALDM